MRGIVFCNSVTIDAWYHDFLSFTPGMSNSDPSAGLKMTFKDYKIVSGPQFRNILNFFSVQKLFHTKICQL